MEEHPVCEQSACVAEAHDTNSAMDQESGVREYCKGLLMRGQEEMSFEELRAERHFELKKRRMQEKLRRLKEEEEQLSQELEKRRQQQLNASQAGNSCGPEKGLCLKVPFPRFPEGVVSSEGSQNSDLDQSEPQNLNLVKIGAKKMYRGDSQKSGPLTTSKPQQNLSPIEETSVEAASLPSLEDSFSGGCSPLERYHSTPGPDSNRPSAAAVNPCDADVRRRLLENSDIFSSLNLYSQCGSIPAVTEHSSLHLGGAVFDIFSTLMDGDGFSVFEASRDDDSVLIKVDSSSTPWDFYQFGRLRSSSAGDGLPLISCFLFDDGCITVYTPPQDHTFTELTELGQDSRLVGCKAIGLLQLLLQLHSCRLLHAALRPNVLTCCHIGCQEPACIFPKDWSTSVDLDLQQNITSVQHLPSAQPYIHLGLLGPSDPPHLVDLVGVAETVYLLLTNSAMVLVKDANGWQAQEFSGDDPCDIYTATWRRFFRSLLNAGRRSPTSILTELKEQLVSLYL